MNKLSAAHESKRGRAHRFDPVEDIGQIEGLSPDTISRDAGVLELVDRLLSVRFLSIVAFEGHLDFGFLELGRKVESSIFAEVDEFAERHECTAGVVQGCPPRGCAILEILDIGRGGVEAVLFAAERLELGESDV